LTKNPDKQKILETQMSKTIDLNEPFYDSDSDEKPQPKKRKLEFDPSPIKKDPSYDIPESKYIEEIERLKNEIQIIKSTNSIDKYPSSCIFIALSDMGYSSSKFKCYDLLDNSIHEKRYDMNRSGVPYTPTCYNKTAKQLSMDINRGLCQFDNDCVAISSFDSRNKIGSLTLWDMKNETHSILSKGSHCRAGYLFGHKDYMFNALNSSHGEKCNVEVWDVGRKQTIQKLNKHYSWTSDVCVAGDVVLVASNKRPENTTLW
jgi:hypothetical protein